MFNVFFFSDSGWTNEDAQVVCRMLGSNPDKSLAVTYSSFGYMYINNYNTSYVECTGSENSIYECPSANNQQVSLCSKSKAAGVICDYEPPSNITIELVGSNNTKEGNVLLNGSPIW